MGSFSKKEAIKFGWGVMKSHFWFFGAALVILTVIQAIPNILTYIGYRTGSSALAILMTAVSMTVFSWTVLVITLVINLGFIKIALQLHDNQPVQLSMLFSQYRFLIKYLLASIIYSLIVLVGFLLLIIPGIIFAIRFKYYSYLIVDQGLGPIEALRQSWRMTKGNVWNLFLLGVLLGLINLGGALLLLVGMLATTPTTMIASAYVFRKLQAATNPVSTPVSANPVQSAPAPVSS